jgi:hypothetical protein
MNSQSNTVKVIRQSKWSAPDKATLPTRVVMWEHLDGRMIGERPTQFVTHLETREGESLNFIWGHYDMTFGEASADFGNRCRLLSVAEDVLIGGLVR